jgi:hypothetical protein
MLRNSSFYKDKGKGKGHPLTGDEKPREVVEA